MIALNNLAKIIHGKEKQAVFFQEIDQAFLEDLDELLQQRDTLKTVLGNRMKTLLPQTDK